jgi:predicted regulator of Ras-like GTPase activity (Roadblock/LC7/MglB family)
MALLGNLKDLKLPNLIQLNCMERNTAKLTIEHAGKFGTIYFKDGQIVHAEFDPDIGEKALYRLLGLAEGKFKVENGVRPPLESISTHWNILLLEGLHYVDTLRASDDGKDRRVLEMLKNVKGVKNTAMIDKEGKLVRSDNDDEKEFALQALLYFEVEKISQYLKLERPKFITVVVQSQRIILTEYDKNIIYVDIEPKYQLETVLPFIEKALS